MAAADAAVKTSAVTQDDAENKTIGPVTAAGGPEVYASGLVNLCSAAGNDQNAERQNERIRIRSRRHKELHDDGSHKRWVIVCFPKRRARSMDHIDAFRIREDVELFREIRMRYEKIRPKWRRLLALRDLHKIRLVKVRALMSDDHEQF
jgi:hypothetical protein